MKPYFFRSSFHSSFLLAPRLTFSVRNVSHRLWDLSSASFFYFYTGGMVVLLLLVIALAIAFGVVEIIELVYLNRSAKLYE